MKVGESKEGVGEVLDTGYLTRLHSLLRLVILISKVG